jgi:phage terminase large subunit-like protein
MYADRIIAEVNYGGAMVESVIRAIDPNVSYRCVTGSRGKVARAEPIAALYEQKKVCHLGSFLELEDEMTGSRRISIERALDTLPVASMRWSGH